MNGRTDCCKKEKGSLFEGLAGSKLKNMGRLFTVEETLLSNIKEENDSTIFYIFMLNHVSVVVLNITAKLFSVLQQPIILTICVFFLILVVVSDSTAVALIIKY